MTVTGVKNNYIETSKTLLADDLVYSCRSCRGIRIKLRQFHNKLKVPLCNFNRFCLWGLSALRSSRLGQVERHETISSILHSSHPNQPFPLTQLGLELHSKSHTQSDHPPGASYFLYAADKQEVTTRLQHRSHPAAGRMMIPPHLRYILWRSPPPPSHFLSLNRASLPRSPSHCISPSPFLLFLPPHARSLHLFTPSRPSSLHPPSSFLRLSDLSSSNLCVFVTFNVSTRFCLSLFVWTQLVSIWSQRPPFTSSAELNRDHKPRSAGLCSYMTPTCETLTQVWTLKSKPALHSSAKPKLDLRWCNIYNNIDYLKSNTINVFTKRLERIIMRNMPRAHLRNISEWYRYKLYNHI